MVGTRKYRINYSTNGSPLVSDVMYSAIQAYVFIRSIKKHKEYGMFVERGWSLGNWQNYSDQGLYNDLKDELQPVSAFLKKNKINASDLKSLLKEL